MADRVQLTDLDVITRYSIAVRKASADRDELVQTLRADLAWLERGLRRTRPGLIGAPDDAAAAAVGDDEAPPMVEADPEVDVEPGADPEPEARRAPLRRMPVKVTPAPRRTATKKVAAKKVAAKAAVKTTAARKAPSRKSTR